MSGQQSNPYTSWLGLSCAPRNYYELLGLTAGERDLTVIQVAAARAVLRLEQRADPTAATQQELIRQQLHSALACLTHPQAKAEYDARLNKQLAKLAMKSSPDRSAKPKSAPVPPPARPPAIRPPAVAADPMAPVVFATEAPTDVVVFPSLPPAADVVSHPEPSFPKPSRPQASRPKSVRRAQRLPAWMYGLVLGCFAVLIACLVLIVNQFVLPRQVRRQQSQPPTPTSASDLPLPVDEALPVAAPTRPTTETQATQPMAPAVGDQSPVEPPPATTAARPVADANVPDAPTPSGVDDPQAPAEIASMVDALLTTTAASAPPSLSTDQRAQLQTLLRQTWSQLKSADVATARDSIEAARILAGETESAHAIRRLAQLTEYVHQFWQAFDATLEALEGDELQVKGKPMFVVEASESRYVFRIAGQNRRYTKLDLPSAITLAVADRGLTDESATTAVLQGAYMAVHSDFTRDQVLAQWREATEAGAELGDLVEVLADRERQAAIDR